MQPSLLDNHHIGHVGGQGGGSRFPAGRDTALLTKFPSLSPERAWGRGSGMYSCPSQWRLPIGSRKRQVSPVLRSNIYPRLNINPQVNIAEERQWNREDRSLFWTVSSWGTCNNARLKYLCTAVVWAFTIKSHNIGKDHAVHTQPFLVGF